MKFASSTTRANSAAFVATAIILVATTLAYGAVHQPAIAATYVMIAAAAALWLGDGLVTGTLFFSRSVLQLPLLGAAVYGFIQVLPFGSWTGAAGIGNVPRTISLDPFKTQVWALHFLALAAFFATTLGVVDRASRVRKLAATITIFGFGLAFYAILQGVLSPTKIYGIYEAASPYGPFVNRHNFAAVMEMTMLLPLGMLFSGAVERDKRLVYATAIGLMGVALALSGSRGGFVSLAAGVIFVAMFAGGKAGGRSRILRIALAAALFALIVAGAFLIGGESSLTRFAETARSQDITTNRAQIWRVTLDVIRNGMPFGSGLGAFGEAYTAFDPSNGSQRVEQAHNDYLQVLADAGIAGFLLAAFFVARLFATGSEALQTSNPQRRGIALGALAGCVAILVHSLFDFVLHTTSISLLFLALCTIVVASARPSEDEPKPESRKRKKENVTPIRETAG